MGLYLGVGPSFSPISGAVQSQAGAVIFVNLRIFIPNFDSYVEVDDLQAKIVVTDEVSRLDISMGYLVLVNKCKHIDKVLAKLLTTRDATPV